MPGRPEGEGSPEAKVSITMQVPKERCFGDTVSGVRPGYAFPPHTPDMLDELKEKGMLNEMDENALKLGFYVYVTESDIFMYYAPPEVDLESPEVQAFLKTVPNFS
jgi:hypothetical protein